METDRDTRIDSPAMKGILYLGALILVLAGCGSQPHVESTVNVGAGGLCNFVLDWREDVYYPEPVAALPARAGSLGFAGAPSCRDILGGETGASRAVEVEQIAGIDPRLAIAAFADPHHGYFAAGTFVQLPSHPLHVFLVQKRALKRCTTARRVVGTVTRNVESLTLRLDGGRAVRVLVDPRTRVAGLSRDGFPYVALGRRVAVATVRCGGELVARRIAPVGSA